MTTSTPHRIAIDDEESILFVRQYCRNLAREVGFGLVDQTRLTTVASELARNVYLYAGTGQAEITRVTDSKRGLNGVEMVFRDQGPGIADIYQAMEQGFSTSGGLGLGLPGSKRLMDEFEIESSARDGTTVTVRKWL
jgi:serine/threonine-protein kinase RsbT